MVKTTRKLPKNAGKYRGAVISWWRDIDEFWLKIFKLFKTIFIEPDREKRRRDHNHWYHHSCSHRKSVESLDWSFRYFEMVWIWSRRQGIGSQSWCQTRRKVQNHFCKCWSCRTYLLGVYDEVQEFSKLSFSWEWKSEPGVVSFVTLLLTPENNFTRMHFEHTHVGHASKHAYTHGWRTTFIKLEQVLIQQEKW